MDNYFRNGAVPLSQSETAMAGPNCSSELPYLNPDSCFDHHYSQFESSLSSIMSSPVAPSSVLCELIGKFGSSSSSAAIDSRHYAGNIVSEESNFGNPLSSPKLQFAIVDQRNPNLGDPASLPLPTPPLAGIAADPAFVERAAKFSCFGSRCFKGRTSQIGHGSGAQPSTAAGDVKLARVSSSPALKPPNGSPLQNHYSGQNLAEIKPGVAEIDRKSGKLPGSAANSKEESSVSDQIETATGGSSRKRKGGSRGKPKEEGSASVEVDSDNGNAKRSKPTESAKTQPNDESEKLKADNKPPEPPKDYIHVRARRGQATDSHSLAERVRREKISERMKLLQDLVPGCNKVTGKALMLDEIINYVQSLQRQVEFLSMKLATVNPSLDFNMENPLSKDVFQQHHNTSLPQPQMYPLDASANVYSQNVEQVLHDANVFRGPLVDPPSCHFPCLDGFSENLPQFPGFIEDDLHSIVQMGFVHNSVNFPDMKVER